jgi:hypothetical protein
MGESPMNVALLLGADEGQRNGRDLPGAFLALPDRRFITVLVSGMGFFTDAYDLFVIGIASTLITSPPALRPRHPSRCARPARHRPVRT